LTQRYKDWKDGRNDLNGQEGFSKDLIPPMYYDGPTRMDHIYNSQDYYKSHPFIYPTPESYFTSEFAIKRALKENGVIYE